MKNLILILLVVVGLGFASSPQLVFQKQTNFGGSNDIPIGFGINGSDFLIWGWQDKNAPGKIRASVKNLDVNFSEKWTSLDSQTTMGLSGAFPLSENASVLYSADFYSQNGCLLFLNSNGELLKKLNFNQYLALGKLDSLAFCISNRAEAYNQNGELVFSWPMEYKGSTEVSIRSLGEFIWISSCISNSKVFVEKRKKFTGELIWMYETSGLRAFGDLDKDGNFYVGFSKYQMDSLWVLQYQVIKIDPDGKEVWREAWHARETILARTQTFCQGLAINEEKNLLVLAGQIQKGENQMNGERSAYVAGLAMSTGKIQWDKTWDYSGAWVSSADGVLFQNNELFILSHSYSSSAGTIPNVIYLEKYTVDKVLGIENPQTLSPAKFRLEQNYPNPFNPNTKIRYSVPNRQYVNLTVYDLLGREITVLVNGEMEAGSHEAHFNATNLPSGTYLYCLQTADKVETRKMVLLK
jgi:hypothetical protein